VVHDLPRPTGRRDAAAERKLLGPPIITA
jgi:hypothetical protein